MSFWGRWFSLIERDFNLDLILSDSQIQRTNIKMVQYDSNAYVVNIKVFEDEETEIDYSIVDKATIAISKPDGTLVLRDLEKTGTGFVYNVEFNELTYAGTAIASVQLYDIDSRLSTARFRFEIIQDLINPILVKSTSEFAILSKIANDIEVAEAERNEAENIRQQNEASRVNNESTRQQNETGRVAAENLRVAAESERQANESIRISAEDARNVAEAGRNSAEQERVNNELARKNAEILRSTAEATREQNETNRQNNENIRQQNETNRQNAEILRIEAENTRNKNEIDRQTAEILRVQAEQSRETNTQERINAVDDALTELRIDADKLYPSETNFSYNDKTEFVSVTENYAAFNGYQESYTVLARENGLVTLAEEIRRWAGQLRKYRHSYLYNVYVGQGEAKIVLSKIRTTYLGVVA